ncbi:glycosyltransferase family 2 protein [Akkermansiaceae bacterium]|nr:glycosyltransferase family 2 protein [Akkermansiaceae bacterium]
METLTVFTPTYNRAHLLEQLYDSLVNQTSKDFLWLIIDDGSTDNTRELVDGWINENLIHVQYHFQNNKGMVGAHNTAHYIMTTELCVCIDSDDFMPENAVQRIIELWNQHGYEKSAGMVGLDSFKDGAIVGAKFPENVKEAKFTEITQKYKAHGDKKFVHNRKVFNKYLPYQFFEGEKFPITSYLYLFIEQNHRWLLFNEVFSIIEYMPDGLSRNLFRQYLESPKSFCLYRKARMAYAYNYKNKFRNTIHYVSSSIMCKNWSLIRDTPSKFTVILAIPLGVVLFLYLKVSNRKTVLKKEYQK